MYWTIFGFLSEGMFLMRFVFQWIATEIQGVSIIPKNFWVIIIIGSIGIIVYSIHIKNIVFLSVSILTLIIYIRSLMKYQDIIPSRQSRRFEEEFGYA